MGEFSSRSEAFLQWFKAQPGASFHADLELADLRDRAAGRGILATADIPADTDLFTIPRSSIINVENSALPVKLPSIFAEEASEENSEENGNDSNEVEGDMPQSWLKLITVMIYEYLRGEMSTWKPYLDILPQSSDFNTLMFWSDSDLEHLQASAIKSKIGKEHATEMFQRRILPIVKKHEDYFYDQSSTKLTDDQLTDLAHRMGSIIMAYAFDLENEDDAEEDEERDGWVQDRENAMSMGMVPMADMLNADAEFNAHLSHGEDQLVMTSIRPIKAGEEVLNYYGPLPNCELLRRYGYTSPKHARYDVVELSWELVESVLKDHWAVDSLGDAIDEDEMEESFVLEREAGDPDETGVNTFPAHFAKFPDELQEQVNTVNAAMMKIDLSKGRIGSDEKLKLKNAFLEVMAKVVDAKLGEYQTTVVEDAAALDNYPTKERLTMAIQVRLGEKLLLTEAGKYVARLLEKDKEVQSSDIAHERPAKRSKLVDDS